MRLAPGTATLGGPIGVHGFEVTTPADAVNRPRAVGSAAGQGVAIQASGSDANLSLALEAKGAGSLVLRTGGGVQAQIAHAAGAVNQVGISGGAARVSAAGADANVALALSPKGTGALLAQTPDGGAEGGATRGANAVDWQQSRNAASQVASGAAAVIAGGTGNTASGNQSWVPGGSRATTRGHLGRGAWSSGFFAIQGDSQAGEFVLRALTTDVTPVRLTADGAAPGAANTVNLPNNGGYRLKILVGSFQTGGTGGAWDSASWEIDLHIKRGTINTAYVGGYSTGPSGNAAIASGAAIAPGIADAAAAGLRVSVAADSTNGGLALTATGEAGKTIRWVARVLAVEVTS
ncbi:hypothetical protein [Sabulicella rubraurantiaca]|uniref:hypothetical protein n=1 Tax=Sabulicella rubraurantiaca TaxID=2811429 RepID=UPI001A974A3A|nr:hypothetical protein [Sabulicella rubraurantiaca]